MRIRTFILSASATVAVAFFGIGYYAVSRVLDHTVRESALTTSSTLAHSTFAGLYQALGTGWNRVQAQAYLRAIRQATGKPTTAVTVYGSPSIEAQYGLPAHAAAAFDAPLRRAFSSGRAATLTHAASVQFLEPLRATESCLRCHSDAARGQVLGVVDVKENFANELARARADLLRWLAIVAPIIAGVTALVVWRVNGRLEQSIDAVSRATSEISGVTDLRRIQFGHVNLGFDELNRLFAQLGQLVEKLRAVAVDKDVLKFEIGLLEKFVITSDVVRDWEDYISRLLTEINTIMQTHVLFSVFQIDDEIFDLEIFWSQAPARTTREIMENHVRSVVAADPRLSGLAQVTVHHHAPPPEHGELALDQRSVVLETKALLLDQPKIGGIVGIGVNAQAVDDEALRLVMDSILSTMLNVVGSVKAIYKYTRDLEYYATRDPLTDLYNRRVFWELFEYEVARASRQGYSFALLVLDLDNFKLINDGFGHRVGDRFLQSFAEAVRKALRPGDLLGRYGGDEFVILLPDVVQDTAAAIARRILESVSGMQVAAGARTATTSVSAGLAVFPLHADNAKDLFLFADSMLYKAKSGGRNQVGVPSEDDVAAAYREMADKTLMVINAVNEGRIEPFFQPIMDVQGGRIVGHEVLSRLSLDGEQLTAERFIEYAERAGVIHQLDIMVMEKALHKISMLDYPHHIFLNLSPRALALADFMQKLKQTVADCGISPAQVVFEISERDTVRNLTVLERLVAELKLAGFKLAIDDYGAGFSSFQYLRRLPIDFVKIDGDFIVNMRQDERDKAFVQAIHGLAAKLGIPVVAEHVESADVLGELKAMGIEFAQGFHVGRPTRDIVTQALKEPIG
ncbi:MAG: bifunctional diguanylate cyclase/phosphodiesterase [Betaproteobacteria bacterium]|nr:bifunctional diguanylate cyclase/phosphodiesterase [Betaproteobacteria bacterium]